MSLKIKKMSSKENIIKIKESLKAGSFSHKWWKHLKKDINKCKLSGEDKILTYCCVIRGLASECYKLAGSNRESLDYVVDTLKGVFEYE